VVNIISQKPKFTYEARLSADVGNYDSTRFEGMVNIPLAEDAVALRIAGAWTKRQGYSENELTGNPIDGRDLWGTRVSLRVEPTDNLSANLIWEHFQENDDRLRSGKQLCKKDQGREINGIPVPHSGNALNSAGRVYNQGCVAGSLYGDESFQTPDGFALPYFIPLIQAGLPAVFMDPYLTATQSRDLRVIESSVDPKYKAGSDLGELQVSFDVTEHLTLTSETAFARDSVWSTQDFNRFTTTPGVFNQNYGQAYGDIHNRPGLLQDGYFCDPQVGCSNRILAVDLSTAKSKHFSQELRLGSDFDGPFNFSLGANFLRYDTEDKYYVFFNTLTLFAASVVNGTTPTPLNMPPWNPATSDNHRCMPRGLTDVNLDQIFDVSMCKYIEGNSIENIQDVGHNYFLSKNPYKLISYAVFGEAYYNITDNLKLTAGLRWTVDKKEAPRVPSQLFIPYSSGFPVAEVVRQEWREPTGRLTLDWKPDLSFTDDTLLYGSYAHGYKAGGANPPTAAITAYCVTCGGGAQDHLDNLQQRSALFPKTFEPEFVDAFEVGAKNTLLDGRLTLNTAAFYYNYKSYQISEIVERAAFNHNYDARVWGLELEADWRPLENLRLGFKGGYENTRVANGEYAIDLMDRTAGDPNWVVAKPFPTESSNCILPAWMATWPGGVDQVRVPGTGVPGPCEEAYLNGNDPVTGLPYMANPTVWRDGTYGQASAWPGYPGWDPSTAPNGGAGIAKHLGGNALPNAPKFTTTVTVDYTVPLPSDWLMTLHTDLYYQSEAWTRIFNMEGYDKLKAYTNVNLAAIFTNEDAGWKVMAYVKNVFDKDNITGAFLNSDDTGLTTNVFLVEPRLYGLRVTKEWKGGQVFAGRHDPHAPSPFTVELAGQAVHDDAPYETVKPDFFDEFPASISPVKAQHQDLDWGQGGSVRLTYHPTSTPWWVEGGVRWGKTNTDNKLRVTHRAEEGSCIVGPPLDLCDTIPDKYITPGSYMVGHPISYANGKTGTLEEHSFVDFMAGMDVGVGGLSRSKIGAGIGYANLTSSLTTTVAGVPWWQMPQYWNLYKYHQHHHFEADLQTKRNFKGAGPIASWDAATRILDLGARGEVDLAWTTRAGVLFGKQKTQTTGQITDEYFDGIYLLIPSAYLAPNTVTTTPVNIRRDKSATVPMLDLSLGLSYEVDRVKVGAGYRWERYFNAIDGGYAEHHSDDRTIDGPYFKIAVGFGG